MTAESKPDFEIERKFLVDGTKLPGDLKFRDVVQFYLSGDPEIRIRIEDDGIKNGHPLP